MGMILRVATWCFLFLSVLAAVSTSFAAPGSPDLQRVLDLANLERAKAGLLPLKWNDTLANAAGTFAQDLAAHNYFSHTGRDGSNPTDRARRAGYPAYGWGGLYVGENLAKGFPTPDGALQGWMGSDGHRANILNSKYRELGVGMAVAPDGTKLWVQEFGSEPNVLPIFINVDSGSTNSVQVTLSITSEEVSSWGSLGPISSMMVSNTSDFAGASWESYAKTKAWTLAGTSGANTVYVRLRDGSGATTESNDTIQYVGTPIAQTQAVAFQVPAAPQQNLRFQLGFKGIADVLGGRVGDPLENEHYGTNGDSLQQTSKGLLVWRKADNWTAFTDGYWTWVNGPFGLQMRTNSQRFEWEK